MVESCLSAPGRPIAIRPLNVPVRNERGDARDPVEPVRMDYGVDVNPQDEADDDDAYMDVDHVDVESENEDEEVGAEPETEEQMDDPLDEL